MNRHLGGFRSSTDEGKPAMSVLTSTPPPTHGAAHDISSRPIRVRGRLAGLAAIGAGAGIVIGHLLTVDPNKPAATYVRDLGTHRATGVAGGLLTSVGAFLLLPAMAAMLRLVRGRGASLATVGAALVGCGAAALAAGDVMITLVMGSLVHGHPDLAENVYRAADSSALIGLPFVFAPLLVIGLVLVGVALLRAAVVPTWEAVLLIVGGLLVVASSGGGVSAAVPLLPLGVALGLLGRRAVIASA
jgi:hypothetical protein